MVAYYNEKDSFAAEWLRKLIAANMIAPGDVDERSIEDVIPVELAKYTQCHFFAGIGGWSYAMRLAGWPDDRHGWSGSCPCQPFSQAGQGAGFADERHLWPAFFHLIEQCRPSIVFGEQVASPDGLAWLDLVQSDMEGTDYAFGALDQCAAGFGTPHIRQRLYWMAYDQCGAAKPWRHDLGATTCGPESETHKRQWLWDDTRPSIDFGGLAYDAIARRTETGQYKCGPSQFPARLTEHGGMVQSAGPTNGHWRNADWLRCKDDKWRPVEPGAFPLAHGVPNRVGLLRGYGNAINAPQAQEFVKAAMQYVP